MLVFIFMNVNNVKNGYDHYPATVAFIVVTPQLNARQSKLEKTVASSNNKPVTVSFFLNPLQQNG
jgi:hypothetical protein